MLAPAMIAVGISSMVVGNATIYISQVASRADSPAHRLKLSLSLLSALAVRQSTTEPPPQTRAEAEQQVGEGSVV
jgi:CIC family chloride channel protein